MSQRYAKHTKFCGPIFMEFNQIHFILLSSCTKSMQVGSVELQRVKHHQKRWSTETSDPLWGQQWQLVRMKIAKDSTSEMMCE